MCIIVYKPQYIDLPSKETLKTCFSANPDGAGYMFPENDKVQIKKGYMRFDEFYDELITDYDRLGKAQPFIMHFRIGTQGGNTPNNTHPFPLSDKITDLKSLRIESDVGIVHNGVIQLTSNYSFHTTTSDTMDFITEYLSLIIHESDWYNKTYYPCDKLLIERLIGGYNKLAILSKDGHTELIGDFIEDDGCFYSNTSYQRTIRYNTDIQWYDGYNELSDTEMQDAYEYFEKFKQSDGWYHFGDMNCPMAYYDDDSYCLACVHFAKCYMGFEDVKSKDCVEGNCQHCRHKYKCPNRIIEEGVKEKKDETNK